MVNGPHVHANSSQTLTVLSPNRTAGIATGSGIVCAVDVNSIPVDKAVLDRSFSPARCIAHLADRSAESLITAGHLPRYLSAARSTPRLWVNNGLVDVDARIRSNERGVTISAASLSVRQRAEAGARAGYPFPHRKAMASRQDESSARAVNDIAAGTLRRSAFVHRVTNQIVVPPCVSRLHADHHDEKCRNQGRDPGDPALE